MISNNYVTLSSRAWYGDGELKLNFPDGWEIQMLSPRDTSKLSETEIQAAFDQPIGTPRIAELAKRKRSAAIIVDDLSRPTPASEVVPFVLRELIQAGVPKSEIRFVVGGGSHRGLTNDEIAKKIGADAAAEYEVVNHDFMAGDLRALGNLDSGLPIYINPVVADADFKICLGGIYPHRSVGFGGGAKLILPGVAGYASIFYFHEYHPKRGRGIIERSGDEPDLRDAAEAAAEVLGLDVIVNIVTNSKREVGGVFVGDFVKAHRVGSQFALETYATRISDQIREETDVLLLNCYPLDWDPIQTGKSLWARAYFDNAYTVIVNPATEGVCYHGLSDQIDYPRFAKRSAAQKPMPLPDPKIGSREQALVWSDLFPVDAFYKRHPNDILFREWDTLIDMLAGKLPRRAKVSVFPCTSTQILVNGD